MRTATSSADHAATPAAEAPLALIVGLWPELRTRRARRLQTVLREGDVAPDLLLVASGWMAQSKTLKDGAVAIIDLLLPGDVALVAAGFPGAAVHSVTALTDAEFLTLDAGRIHAAGPATERLRRALTTTVAASQARASELILRLGRGSAAMRIAFMLIELHVRLNGRLTGPPTGTADDAPCRSEAPAGYDIPLTQEMIGQFTGLSNVHVCRTLRRFARAGLVTSADHRIEIRDIDALCEVADIDLDAFRAEILPKRLV